MRITCAIIATAFLAGCGGANPVGNLLPQGSQVAYDPFTGEAFFGDRLQAAGAIVPPAGPRPPLNQPPSGLSLPGSNVLSAGGAPRSTRSSAINQAANTTEPPFDPTRGPNFDPRPRVRYHPPSSGPTQDNQPIQTLGTPPYQSAQTTIAEIQQLLRSLGLNPGPVSGEFTPQTRSALQAYTHQLGQQFDGRVTADLVQSLRRDAGLIGPAPTGDYNAFPQRSAPSRAGVPTAQQSNVGLLTSAAFGSTTAGGPAGINRAARRGGTFDESAASTNLIGEIQTILTQLGHAPGPVDGIYSAATSQAVAAYQSQRRLAVDGRLTGPLLAALRSETLSAASRQLGSARQIGSGQVSTYVEFGIDSRPISVGVIMEAASLSGLPAQMIDTSRCADRDADGAVDPVNECLAAGDVALALPSGTNGFLAELPVRWIGVTWMPQGHRPETAPNGTPIWPPSWQAPHLSFYFHLLDHDRVHSIAPGTCAGLTDCEDFARAIAPLPAPLQPAGFVSTGAVMPGAGNHLIDAASMAGTPGYSHEFAGAFGYGTFDGQLSFLAVKAAPDYLNSRPSGCYAISQRTRLPSPDATRRLIAFANGPIWVVSRYRWRVLSIVRDCWESPAAKPKIPAQSCRLPANHPHI